MRDIIVCRKTNGRLRMAAILLLEAACRPPPTILLLEVVRAPPHTEEPFLPVSREDDDDADRPVLVAVLVPAPSHEGGGYGPTYGRRRPRPQRVPL